LRPWDNRTMGILDRILGRKALADPSAPLPLPLGQSRDIYLTGYGSGQLVSMLRRVLPGSHRDWSNVAGDLGLNSVVATAMDWYVRNWPQGRPLVMRSVDSQQVEPVEDHPILALMAEPEPGMVGNLLWGWVIQDYKLFGNAYLRKQRLSGPGSQVVALQYLPQDMVRPVGDGRKPLTHYVYTTDGRSYDLPVEDVIHFRYGRDPSDMRLGRSTVQSVLREIATDNVASSAAFGLLSNGAMPSIIVGPDASGSAQVDISPDDARQVKQSLRENLTGDNAGGIVVMSGPYKLDKVSLSPNELALDSIRRVPEERICSALGLNPMVLGLGSGLERSTYSNYERAQQAAWEDGMVPLMRAVADTLTVSLLPDFPESQEGDKVEFDLAGVRALADDRQAEAERAERLYKGGISDRAEAKRIAGLEATPEDEGAMFPGSASEPTTPATQPQVRSLDTKSHPTAAMQEAARRALAWKDEGRAGGTRVGLARAHQIVNGDLISEDTILRMHSFFSRHEVDKEAEGFSDGEPGFPSPGRVAWDLWGGDAGQAWASRLRDKIMRGEKLPAKGDHTCGSEEGPYFSHPFFDVLIGRPD
jgi:HK97 family phage portal protein